MRDLPRTGLELVSPALAGGFLTTAPPGESKLALNLITNFGTEHYGALHIEIMISFKVP